jgi:hypothetical protein
MSMRTAIRGAVVAASLSIAATASAQQAFCGEGAIPDQPLVLRGPGMQDQPLPAATLKETGTQLMFDDSVYTVRELEMEGGIRKSLFDGVFAAEVDFLAAKGDNFDRQIFSRAAGQTRHTRIRSPGDVARTNESAGLKREDSQPSPLIILPLRDRGHQRPLSRLGARRIWLAKWHGAARQDSRVRPWRSEGSLRFFPERPDGGGRQLHRDGEVSFPVTRGYGHPSPCCDRAPRLWSPLKNRSMGKMKFTTTAAFLGFSSLVALAGCSQPTPPPPPPQPAYVAPPPMMAPPPVMARSHVHKHVVRHGKVVHRTTVHHRHTTTKTTTTTTTHH